MDGYGGQEPGWQQPAEGPVAKAGYPPAILVGFGVIVVLLVAIGVVLVTGDDSSGGGDDSELTAASDDEADEAEGDPTEPDEPADDPAEPAEDETSEAEPDEASDLDDLPPPEIPENADPPPIEGLEDMTFPYDAWEGVDWPTIGGTMVEVTPGEYVDLAVHLEPGELIVSFPGNEGIRATVEVYGPDGSVLQVAEDLGEPGLVEWMEFTNRETEPLDVAGTYVFRVIQHSGRTDGMAIGFFAPPE